MLRNSFHTLADWIWYDAGLEMRTRLELALVLYRDMPSYANLMYVSMFYPTLDACECRDKSRPVNAVKSG